LNGLTIHQARQMLRAKKISSVELTTAALRVIDRLNPALNAFLTITADAALTAARKADEDLAKGVDRGALHGIPIAHKDLFDTAGVRTTYGSSIFTNHVPERDAAVVAQCAAAGAVPLGKLGLHELAYGITSLNPHFGAVKNPWADDRVPGGSSGGSGTAVATGMALMATGTDTGGSIRIPASFCGVAGFKPTYGTLSTEGCRPLSETLDHMGPLAPTARDCALTMSALTGDLFELPEEPALKGVRVGLPRNFFFDHAEQEVRASIDRAAKAAKEAGAEIVEVEIEAASELVEFALAIILAEGASSAADVRGRLDDVGADVRVRFEQGWSQDPAIYLAAQRGRVAAQRRFLRVFEQCEFLLATCSPWPAPTVDAAGGVAGNDLRIATTRPQRPINLLGIPALSIPTGLSSAGLPLSAQILGPHRSDLGVLRVGVAIEQRLGLPVASERFKG
jgi:aspartyl-tRNA(Asn)/glutamyl-tRNA(Gln) amidotransferase subunit A